MTRKLRELTIKDNFMFGAVMAEEENCRGLLELVTDIPIQRVEVSREKSFVYHPQYKGVRLDVYANDERNTCYNVEMQVARRPALGRRARFYRSQMDMELLLKGRDYPELPEAYVIFICDFDPFGGGYYRYTFESVCLEDSTQKMQEGCRCIFLNAVGNRPEAVPAALVHFLQYVHADLESSEEDFQDLFVEQLQKAVRHVKESREMEERYMVLEEMLREERAEGRMEGRAEGKAEGRIEGRTEGKAEAIVELLRNKGPVSGPLEEKILCERDEKVLTSWLLLAAGADTAEEFEKQISR